MISGKSYPKPSNSWSLGNLMTMILKDTQDARTFLQWKEVGRYPLNKANFYIFGPMMKKEKAEKPGDKSVSRLFGFRPIPVFSLENTDGEPIVKGDFNPPQLPKLSEVAERWGIRLQFTPAFDNCSYLGFYQQKHERIVLCTHDESVFFHELAHAAHGKIDGDLSKIHSWEKEIIAEFSAMILSQFFGREISGNHFEYLKHYSEKAKKSLEDSVLKMLSKTGKVVNLILEEGEGLKKVPQLAAA